MKKILIATVVVLPLLTGVAYADGPYTGIEYTGLKLSSSDTVLDAFLVTSGYQFNHWLSLEGRIGKSRMAEEDDVSFEVNNLFGVYAKFNGRNKISPVSPYFMVGYTRTKTWIIDEDGDDLGNIVSDVSLGLGLDFSIDENLYIGLEGVSYIREEGDKLTGYSLGINYKF